MSADDQRVFSHEIYFKFPWLNGASDILFAENRSLTTETISILDSVRYLLEKFPDLKDRIILFLQNAIEAKEVIETSTEDETNLALYPILQIFIDMLGNRILANALANIYAKHCQAELDNMNKYPDLFLKNLCANLGIRVELLSKKRIEETLYPFQMHFASYLAASTWIKDEAYKLINRPVDNGYVFLIRHDLIMLIREYIRKKTMPNLTDLDKETIAQLEEDPQVYEVIQTINDLITTNSKRFKSDWLSQGEKIDSDFFPPCIRAILFRAVHGENLGHYERLSLAFFYLNTNHSIEETADLFRTCPDFDEKITRYQSNLRRDQGEKAKNTPCLVVLN